MRLPTNIELASALSEQEFHPEPELGLSRDGLGRFLDASERSRRRLLAKAGALAGSLVLAASLVPTSSGEGRALHPTKYVGFVEPEIFTTDPAQAERVAAQIKALGGNSVRFTANINHYQTVPTPIDQASFCNAMAAAQKEGLYPILTTQGYEEDSGKPRRDYVPTTPADIANFTSVLLSYERLAAGPPAAETPPGHIARCVQLLKHPIKKLAFELVNEPNLSSFVKQTFVNGRWMNPQEIVNILAVATPALKAKARQLGMNLKIWVGALADDHNDPLFIKQMGIAIKKLHLKIGQKLFDVLSWHPYVPDEDVSQTHPNGYKIGIADTPMLEQVSYQAFGYIPRIVASEFGIQTSEPAGQYGYSVSTKGLDPPFFYEPEQQQAQQYKEALGILSCDPNIDGMLIFHVFDIGDAKNPLGRSGIIHPDGSEKDGYNTVKTAETADVKGDLANCAEANLYDRVVPTNKPQTRSHQPDRPTAHQHSRSYAGPH